MYVLPFRIKRCDIQSEAKLAANISSNLECFWFFKCKLNGFIIEKITFKSQFCALVVNCTSINERPLFYKIWLMSYHFSLVFFPIQLPQISSLTHLGLPSLCNYFCTVLSFYFLINKANSGGLPCCIFSKKLLPCVIDFLVLNIFF